MIGLYNVIRVKRHSHEDEEKEKERERERERATETVSSTDDAVTAATSFSVTNAHESPLA